MKIVPKVLISDKLSPLASEILQEKGIDVDVKTGLSPDELADIILDYDGLAIRSTTKVTAEILAAAPNLKVVGRAGIGVDNIDIPSEKLFLSDLNNFINLDNYTPQFFINFHSRAPPKI